MYKYRGVIDLFLERMQFYMQHTADNEKKSGKLLIETNVTHNVFKHYKYRKKSTASGDN